MDIIRVDEWLPNKEDCIVKYDGKLIVMPFDEIFERESLQILNMFNICKDSYVRKLNMITLYINYFIKFYDTDNELMMAYLKLKSMADDKKQNMSDIVYIKFLYNILLTDSIQQKIIKMTEDNYYIDVSAREDTTQKYNESLEFTNEHAKILMQISIAMKLMTPLMMHYINNLKYEEEKRRSKRKDRTRAIQFDYRPKIYLFYIKLFDIFGGDVDIYNKLWVLVCSRTNVHHSSNKLTWEQRAIYGTTPDSYTQEMFEERIVCETIYRYVFNKNIISYKHVILRRQLQFFTYEDYGLNRIELSTMRDKATGLTGIDKLEMNSIKLDESVAIVSDVNIKHTIKELSKSLKVEFSKDEIKYYEKYIGMDKFQVDLCQYFYAKLFGGHRDLSLISKRQYIKLVLLLKKRLRLQEMTYIPYILSSRIDGRLNARTIRNDKFLTKIKSSDLYNDILTNKFYVLEDMGKGDVIINILSPLINTKFIFVEYDNPELTGERIEVNPDAISDEFLNFLNQL